VVRVIKSLQDPLEVGNKLPAVVKLIGKRWWILAGAKIEGPRAEARARRAESRGGVPDRRPNINCAEW